MSIFEEIDMESTLLDIFNTLHRINIFPVLEIAHYIVMCCLVKDDTPQRGCVTYSKAHPLASWVAAMLMCFANGFITNFLLGLAPLSAVKTQNHLIIATAVWYCINYLPLDLAYKLCKLWPVQFVLIAVQELLRARGVAEGVSAGCDKFGSDAYLPIIIVGMTSGSGYLQMIFIQRATRGVWLPAANELMRPSLTTKVTAMGSVAFTVQHYYPHVLQRISSGIAAEHVFGCVLVAFLLHRIKLVQVAITLLEAKFCQLFLTRSSYALRTEQQTESAAAAAGGDAAATAAAAAAIDSDKSSSSKLDKKRN